jgi:hypothetical protein
MTGHSRLARIKSAIDYVEFTTHRSDPVRGAGDETRALLGAVSMPFNASVRHRSFLDLREYCPRGLLFGTFFLAVKSLGDIAEPLVHLLGVPLDIAKLSMRCSGTEDARGKDEEEDKRQCSPDCDEANPVQYLLDKFVDSSFH